MLKPEKTAYRVCPACSLPIPLREDQCHHCGHSVSRHIADLEANHILLGKVFYNGQWVSIEDKVKAEKFIETQLAAGKVEYNGEWISIEEKVKREKNTPPRESENLVEFPVKPLILPDQSAEANAIPGNAVVKNPEEASLRWVKMKKRRRFVVIVLSLFTFLTMAIAAFGIFFSRGSLFH